MKLSDITDGDVRNARQYQTAEIPEIEHQEAQAELVGEEVDDGEDSSCNPADSNRSVPFEIISEDLQCSASWREDVVHMLDAENYLDAPLAPDVVAIVDEDSSNDADDDSVIRCSSSSDPRQRMALQRMQELDPIHVTCPTKDTVTDAGLLLVTSSLF